MITIALPSVMSLYLDAQFNGVSLSSGTGFLVEKDGQLYLITNWHVASGRRTDTGQSMHTHGAVPNTLIIHHNMQGHLGQWIAMSEPLYDGTNDPANDRPLWLEHPVHCRQVDVVALPLHNLANVARHPYDPWSPPVPIKVGPSDMVSVPGFPFGQRAGGLLAIWVQGAIASEPGIDVDDLPLMLIDSRTKPGSSGSPVIAYRGGGEVAAEGGGSIMFDRPVWRFLGTYSGQIEERSDIGRVWKASVIPEIVAGQQRGSV